MNIESINNANLNSRIASPDLATPVGRVSAPLRKEAEATKNTLNADTQSNKLPDKKEVEAAVKQIAEFVSSRQSEINFSIDESSGSQIVKIMDTTSNQVIRQFPSEVAVAIARALDTLQGLLIKDKA